MSPRSPLFRPREYFESGNGRLGPGLGVFALHVLGTVVFVYAAVQLFLAQIENLPPEGERAMSRAMSEMFGTLVPILIVMAALGLVVVAAVMHFLSGGSGTAGSFPDAVAVAGWAYAPDMLALPVKYLLAWRYAAGLSLDGSDPQVLAAQVESIQQPTGVLDGLVALIVVGWSVYILAEGTAGTHDVAVERTAIPALLVGLGSLLLRLA